MHDTAKIGCGHRETGLGRNVPPERSGRTDEGPVRVPIARNSPSDPSQEKLAGFALGAPGVAYALVFVPLCAALGNRVLPLRTVLACGAGCLWGTRAGLSAGALSLPLHLLLLGATGGPAWSSALGRGNLVSTLVSVVVGGMVGLLRASHDLPEARLQQQALHDALTGLSNRALLCDRLRHALARATRRKASVAVLFVDLDGFKRVNDSLVHRAGDELLVAVAERLRGCLRPEDALARMGGDEFAVVLEDVSPKGDPSRGADRTGATTPPRPCGGAIGARHRQHRRSPEYLRRGRR